MQERWGGGGMATVELQVSTNSSISRVKRFTENPPDGVREGLSFPSPNPN